MKSRFRTITLTFFPGKMRGGVWPLFLLLVITGCSRSLAGVRFDYGMADDMKPTAKQISIRYDGVGCFFIRYGKTAILTDPYWSNLSKAELMFGKALPRKRRIDPVKPDVSRVKMVLVGHGHFDHVMDFPYVAPDFKAGTKLVANESVVNQLKPVEWKGKCVDGQAKAADQVRQGKWIYESDSTCRVMPVLSGHGPHLLGLHFFRKSVEAPASALPEKTSGWKEGQSLGYLIDFLDSGRIAYRMYMQSSIDHPPAGLFPDALLREKTIDLAILPPTIGDKYWKDRGKLLEKINPETVMLCHWENFFIPRDEVQKAVPKTNLKKAQERLLEYYDFDLILPKIGSVHFLDMD